MVAREKPDWVLRMQQERVSSTGYQVGAVTWLVNLGRPVHGALTSSGATRETVVYRFRYSALGSYCLGTYRIDVVRPAGDACMEKHADIIVGRLKANGFLE